MDSLTDYLQLNVVAFLVATPIVVASLVCQVVSLKINPNTGGIHSSLLKIQSISLIVGCIAMQLLLVLFLFVAASLIFILPLGGVMLFTCFVGSYLLSVMAYDDWRLMSDEDYLDVYPRHTYYSFVFIPPVLQVFLALIIAFTLSHAMHGAYFILVLPIFIAYAVSCCFLMGATVRLQRTDFENHFMRTRLKLSSSLILMMALTTLPLVISLILSLIFNIYIAEFIWFIVIVLYLSQGIWILIARSSVFGSCTRHTVPLANMEMM